MEILITGVNGFLATYLIEKLIANNIVIGIGKQPVPKNKEIYYYSTDITDKNELTNIFIKHNISAVIHLAALTSHAEIIDNKYEALHINYEGTRNLLVCFRQYCKNAIFLYASSGKVYGQTNEMPISENAITNPTTILGKSKLICERLIDFFSYRDEINKYCIARIFNVYGKGQKENFIIPTITRMIRKGNILSLGNVDDSRDYIYIEDLVNALCSIIDYKYFNTENFSIINVGSGKPITVREIISIFERIKSDKYKIKQDASKLRYDETDMEYANIDKIKKIYNWYPQFSMEQGLLEILKA